VLLLEYAAECQSRQRRSYLLSGCAQVAGDMSSQVREWVTAVLADISSDQLNPQLSTDEMFSWYSYLDVGPLRTTCVGHFNCDSLSEAFASIKENVISQARSSEGDRYFPDFLVPLDGVTLRSNGWLPQDHSQLKLRKSS
jgi:hypothetical protein